MPCNNPNHSYDCECHNGGEVKQIYINEDQTSLVGYNGLLAFLPDQNEDPDLFNWFNSIIVQYNGLDGACEVYPYVELDINRYGYFVPRDGNTLSKYTNLFHIMRARRKIEPHEYDKMNKQQTTQTPVLTENPALERGCTRDMGVSSLIENESKDGWEFHMPSFLEDGSPMQEYTKPEGYLTEEERFEIALKSVAVVNQPEDDTYKQPIDGFYYSRLAATVKDDVPQEYSFNAMKVGNMVPEGEVNTNWHPNDPANFPKQQQTLPFMPQFIGSQPPLFNHTPGFVNENKPEKETFFSVGRMAQDAAKQKAVKTDGPFTMEEILGAGQDDEISRINAQYRENMKKIGTPDWKPNNLVVKTNEFPEGITESHPEFERVRQQTFNSFAPEMHIAEQFIPGPQDDNPEDVIDTSDPEAMARFFQNPFEGEDDDLLEQQFGDRFKVYRASQTEQQRIAAMEGQQMITPTVPMYSPPSIPGFVPAWGEGEVNPYYQNNPYLANHQNIMGGLGLPGLGANRFFGGYYDDKEWMLPTEQEILTGKYPVAYIGYEKEEEEEKPPVEYKKRDELEEIKAALVFVHHDDNGVEYHEFISGDIEAVQPRPSKNSSEYKNKAADVALNKAEEDTYLLAKELRRYNSNLADTLLWYQQNADLREYVEMKREAQEQLIKYRNEDPLACIKSTVFIAGDKTMVSSGKPTSVEELKRLTQPPKPPTQEEKEQAIIDNYRNKANAIAEQRRIVLNSNSLSDIVSRIQALVDVKVVCSNEEAKMYERFNRVPLNPVQIDEQNNYLTWKQMMRSAKRYRGEDLDDFDKWFDEWWMKPRIKTPEQKAKDYDTYVNMMTERNVNHLMMVEMSQISPEERERRYVEATLASYREFDKGVLRPDMNFAEFCEANNYLLCRLKEVRIERAANETKRLFNPNDFMAYLRKHSAMRNFQDGKGYIPTTDLMNQEEYYKKRQKFVGQIFKKANRGMIT